MQDTFFRVADLIPFPELSLFPIREEEEDPAAAAVLLAHNGQEKLAPSTIVSKRKGSRDKTQTQTQPTPLSPTAVNSAGDKLRS